MNTELELSITDMAVLKNSIDLACSRGAFRANEMKTIGETYEKLSAFLQTVIKQAESQSMAEAKQGEIK